MQHTRADEFRLLEALSENCSDFGQRLLLFPSATTFHTYPKNRYKNILPNENTRVKLNPISNQEGSDYINANYITLPITEEEACVYISTQAPLETTFADFWRMVWEQRSTCIVSLTKLSEKNRVKADRYWPSQVGESECYGDFTVVNQHVLDLGFIVRKFELSKNEEARTILQFHYSDWPDFGVPHRSTDIRHMIQLSDIWKQECAETDGPLIVHCSAGVGRSGSFIAMHAGMKCLQKTIKGEGSSNGCEQGTSQGTDMEMLVEHVEEGMVESSRNTMAETGGTGGEGGGQASSNEQELEMPNVMDLVRRMRNQRHGMVQTIEQYEFIYTVLDDEIEERRNGRNNGASRARSSSGSGGSSSGEGLLSGTSGQTGSSPATGTSFEMEPFGSISRSGGTGSSTCSPSCLSCSSCSSSPLSPSSTSSPSSPTSPEDSRLDFEKILAALTCSHPPTHSFEESEKDRNNPKASQKVDLPNTITNENRNEDGNTDPEVCEINCSPQSSEVFIPAVAVSG